MTVICAFHKPGEGTWIGSDQARYFNEARYLIHRGKWHLFKNGWAIGSAGNSRALDAIYLHDIRASPPEDLVKFTEWLREAFRADGYKFHDSDGRPQCVDCVFIVASPHFAHRIGGDFTLTPCAPETLVVSGSGEDFVLGYNWGHGNYLLPETRVRQSIECACDLDYRCRGSWVHHLKET